MALAWALRMLAKSFYRVEWNSLRNAAIPVMRKVRLDSGTAQLGQICAVLVLAEDRRFFSHSGIDMRAIGRAMLVSFLGAQIQGGSTITQQLVRNLTGNYARTFKRKYLELVLASLLDAEFSKEELLYGYLSVAYFGWRMNGVRQAIRRLEFATPLTVTQSAQIVARLKYPEPQFPSQIQKDRICRRAVHIENLFRKFHSSI